MKHSGPVDGVAIPEELPGLNAGLLLLLRLLHRRPGREGQTHPARTGRGQSAAAGRLRGLLVGRRGGGTAEDHVGTTTNATHTTTPVSAQGSARKGQADGGAGEVPGVARRRRVQRDHLGLARRPRRRRGALLLLRGSRRRPGAILRHQVDGLSVPERLAPDAELDPGRPAARRGGDGGDDFFDGGTIRNSGGMDHAFFFGCCCCGFGRGLDWIGLDSTATQIRYD
mmetsp:Transcript_32118/g.94541  ORF Transcript_32118/g.94541 Transcript_32118/m.94541 type:complete len:226 (+) Transcript_32118:117-794(+)